MKPRRLFVVAVGAFAFVLVVLFVASTYWERGQTPFQNAPKLIHALQAFSRDQAAAGRRLPPEISVNELLRGGYLNTNDVRDFVGMDLTFSTRADGTNPPMILAHARTPSGQYACLLVDGSAQLFSRHTFERMRAVERQTGAGDGSR